MDDIVRTDFDPASRHELLPEERAQLERVAALGDASLDLTDIPEASFDQAVPLREVLFRPRKQSTTVRIDADVLHWLKAGGPGYQSRINAILREAMQRDRR
jgi:uncharacterized protein (DUF4415 family)